MSVAVLLSVLLIGSAAGRGTLVHDAPPVCAPLLEDEPDLAALEAEVSTWKAPVDSDWYLVCTSIQTAPARGKKPHTPIIIPLLVILAPPVGIAAAIDLEGRPTPGYTPAQYEKITVEMLVGAHEDPRVPLLFARYGMDRGVVAERFKVHVEQGDLAAARVFVPLVERSVVARREYFHHYRNESALFSDWDGDRTPLPDGDWLSHPDLWPAMGAVGFDLCPLVVPALDADLAEGLVNGVGACDDGLAPAAWFGWHDLPVPDTADAFDKHHDPLPLWSRRMAAFLGVDAVAPDGPAAMYWAVRVGEEHLGFLTWGVGPPTDDYRTYVPEGWRAVPFEFRWGRFGEGHIPEARVAALDDALARCDADRVAALRSADPSARPTPLGWFAAAEVCPSLALEVAGDLPALNAPQALRWDLGPELSAQLGRVLEVGPGMGWRDVRVPETWIRASRRALRRALRRRGELSGTSVWWER